MDRLEPLADSEDRPDHIELIFLLNAVVEYFASCSIVLRLVDVADAAAREVNSIDLCKQGVQLLIRQIVPDWDSVRTRILDEVDVVLPGKVVKLKVGRPH